MTVEIGSLIIRASFSDDANDDEAEESNMSEALAITERRIIDQVTDMISEAFRRHEER